jgi:hypothetical protein
MGVPLIVGDRVLVQTTTTGTGTYQLGAALDGFVTPQVGGVPSGSRVPYVVVDDLLAPGQFEIGEGIYTAGSPATITRATIKRSSASNGAVSWPAGTRYLLLSPHAGLLPLLDTDGKLLSSAMPTGAASILRSGNPVAVPNSTPATLTWNVNAANTLGGIDPGLSNWSAIVIATGGLHSIKAAANFAANPNGIRELRIVVNGTIFAIDRRLALSAGDIVCSCSVDLVVGNNSTVVAQIYQDCGGPLNVGGTAWSQMSVARVVG